MTTRVRRPPGIALAAALASIPLACSLGRAKQEAVLEAVFVYEMTQFLGQDRAAVCLQTSDGRAKGDPGAALMGRMSRHATVHGASACRVEPSGVTVAASGQPAVLLSAGPIDWVAEHEAQVGGGYFRSGVSLANPTYRVVRQGGRWTCLGPILKGLPL